MALTKIHDKLFELIQDFQTQSTSLVFLHSHIPHAWGCKRMCLYPCQRTYYLLTGRYIRCNIHALYRLYELGVDTDRAHTLVIECQDSCIFIWVGLVMLTPHPH